MSTYPLAISRISFLFNIGHYISVIYYNANASKTFRYEYITDPTVQVRISFQ